MISWLVFSLPFLALRAPAWVSPPSLAVTFSEGQIHSLLSHQSGVLHGQGVVGHHRRSARLFLPALVVRFFVLKVIGKDVPIGNPIADTRLISPMAIHEAAEIRERHVAFQRAESTFPALGFTDIRYFRSDDPRSPHSSGPLGRDRTTHR